MSLGSPFPLLPFSTSQFTNLLGISWLVSIPQQRNASRSKVYLEALSPSAHIQTCRRSVPWMLGWVAGLNLNHLVSQYMYVIVGF